MRDRSERDWVLRHGVRTRVIHWTIALSTFGLLFTGLGQMPVYRRYNLVALPGLGWADHYPITLSLHYIFAATLMAALTFHVVLHLIDRRWELMPRRGDLAGAARNYVAHVRRNQTPAPAGKFLPEQRLAYAYMALSFLLVVATGLVKVYKNLPGAELPGSWIRVATTVHNVATVMVLLGVVAHLGALFIFQDNWTLVPSIFHGRVPAAYARRRHSRWLPEEEAIGVRNRRAG